jgi:thioredoxin reductase (NADPH)
MESSHLEPVQALVVRSDRLRVGHASHADVLRLQGFLARNGQPHRVLDSDSDSCAKTLIERFDVDAHHLPIVLCPNGKLLRNPSENELARCIGLLRPIDAKKAYDVAIVGAGPAGLAAAVYAASESASSKRASALGC